MFHKAIFALAALLFASTSIAGPFTGAAGTAGSKAIYKDDSRFVQWATGYQNYNPGSNVTASFQTPEKALGKAVGDSYDIVSLGDKGVITLTFGGSIYNGAGDDFAIFENSFSDTFLELAFVEVSSNGVDFFRFTNYSLNKTAVGAFGSVDPTNIDGLAGKYRQGYGTGFDLASLIGVSALLDVNNVQYVRLVDIAGDGSEFDSLGNKIYDPYKTSGSGGFDLDAVGVINFIAAVPEPSEFAMLGIALVILPFFVRRQKRRQTTLS